MLKGTKQKNRDSRWHKRHEKKLLKDRRRHNRGQNFMRKTKSDFSHVEKKLKKARKEKPKMSRSRRLLLWFIASRLGFYIQNKLEKLRERRYKG